jgi:capsular exopolysaccharide synthesis family protein
MSRIDAAIRRATERVASGAPVPESAPEDRARPSSVATEVSRMVHRWEPVARAAEQPERVTSMAPVSEAAPEDAADSSVVATEVARMVHRWDTTARVVEAPKPQPVPATTSGPPPKTIDPERLTALVQGAGPDISEKLVIAPTVRFFSVEQYRKLAATLHQAQVQHGFKTILMASAMPGEGKTLTSVNLALTFSESYRRQTLLIDADLRHPTLHKVFQATNNSGLNDALKPDPEHRLSPIQVSPHLALLTAGPPDPDPMSILTSDRMRRVIAQAATRYDWVILDTPPVGLLPDAKLLAAMVDVVLLVVQAGATQYRSVYRAVDAIGRDRIMGVVLNCVDESLASDERYAAYYDTTRSWR